jgi:hypothetical protein
MPREDFMQPCWDNPLPMAMQQHGGRTKSIDVTSAFTQEKESDLIAPNPDGAQTLTVDSHYRAAVTHEP